MIKQEELHALTSEMIHYHELIIEAMKVATPDGVSVSGSIDNIALYRAKIASIQATKDELLTTTRGMSGVQE